MFENIMVPSDGSKYSDKAVELAIEIAKKFNSKITAVHVIDEKTMFPYEKLEDEGNEILEKIAKKGFKAGIEVTEQLITGDPLRDMKTIAKKANVDSIVISTHGRNKLEKLMVGSVTDRVIQTFDIPVILAK
ncbi:putative universal stress protein [Methanobrevibacter cuticularis]|uniref:Putative universal stress protein n=1 Tax=Methanobrevibacter cuticularis TaxID=47311 RepID=A0A166DQR6_9EURY|nr:universal stress protein [Methanobrevibacter cuticularis]KZX15856.1 putative universal stress protein [Methanobrevibacter cuticularis]